ncbi:MAG: chemotaxis protein CheW [Helicobacteraceae bacterium]|nr:chemotaxis protein CheW [Candidatus Sulfurimonas ponti]MBL6972793.1 chemotaxis protein CheW [Sulfurimonas sp.]
MDFLEIEIKAQRYLLSSEHINELIQYTEPQPIAGSSDLIEGIISHKDKVLPIISIRKLLGFETYTSAQLQLLHDVEGQHIAWVKDYENSLRSGEKFTKALDPHMCVLGKWIDTTLQCLKCNANGYIDILKREVIGHHNALHLEGAKYLENISDDMSIDEKIKIIEMHKTNTIKGIHSLRDNIQKLTLAFEQVIICDINGVDVGFIVDNIEKNHTLDEKHYHTKTTNLSPNSPYIQFIEHYEINKKLMFSIKFTDKLFNLVKSFKQQSL